MFPGERLHHTSSKHIHALVQVGSDQSTSSFLSWIAAMMYHPGHRMPLPHSHSRRLSSPASLLMPRAKYCTPHSGCVHVKDSLQPATTLQLLHMQKIDRQDKSHDIHDVRKVSNLVDEIVSVGRKRYHNSHATSRHMSWAAKGCSEIHQIFPL